MTVQKRTYFLLFLPPRHLFSQAWISCSEMKDEEWSATVDCVFVLSESRTWTLTPDLSSASSVASQCQCIKHSKFSKLSVHGPCPMSCYTYLFVQLHILVAMIGAWLSGHSLPLSHDLWMLMCRPFIILTIHAGPVITLPATKSVSK